MSNAIDSTGLTIDTPAQTRDKFLNGTAAYPGMYQIYGNDINVAPNSPDGQMIDIGVQFTQDFLEFLQQIFTSMDPDQAVGRVLDQRCAINGVVRNAGTKTTTLVAVTTSQALTLTGLDVDPVNPFTVADGAGNQYQLLVTYAFGSATTQSLVFQAANLGAIVPAINSITTIVTITLGVASVNNPSSALTIGTNEENDNSLRIRRAKSVALPSRGYFDGLYGALVDIPDVTSVKLLENDTSSTDANGIPSHSIWAIVNGGTNVAIANAIYVKRNAGCGMKGSVTVAVNQLDKSTFNIQFDRPIAQNLWVKVSVHPLTGSVDTAYLSDQILARLTYAIGQTATASALVVLVQELAPNCAVSAEGVSTNGTTFLSLVNPTDVQHQFALSSGRIAVTAI